MKTRNCRCVGLTLLIVGVMLMAIPIPLTGIPIESNEAEALELFSQLVGDELVIGDHTFAIHGELENRQLFLDGTLLSLNEIVPWWVSGLELDGSMHMVIGDSAYRHFLSHYIVSSDEGKTWKIVESFDGYLKPHITALDGTIHIMFERNLDLEENCLFKLINGQFTMIKGDQSYSYADVLDYRTTEEYAEYDAVRKSEVFGHPPERSTRAPEKPWSYLYICNGEASGIESLLEDDANEMAAGGSSANHWAVCFFDDDGAGPNEMRVMDEGGGGGYTIFTTAELGLPAEPDLNDPSQIIIILDWWFTNYPGKRLVFDSGGHGGGTSGAIYGENPTSGVIDLVEITTIADAVRASFTKPIDITSWDQCQMMTQEWLYGYKPITNYTVCSMDNIAGAGYNYENLMNYLAASVPTPAQMAHEISLDYWTGVSSFISTVDMNNWDYTFWPTFNNLAQELTHGTHLTEINSAHSSAWVAQKCHDVWEWMDNINTGISDPTIQALSLQARDEVWTSNYPTGLDDVVQVEYGSSASHHGIGDEAVTNAAWMIDVETMRDEMLSVQGVSNAIPTCTVTTPTEASDIPMDGIFNIQGTASDSDGSVSRVEVKINREWWQVATGTNSWSFSWDVSATKDYYGLGPCKLWARSYDGTDYSNWECINVNIIESFGSEGNIYLDSSVYPVEDTMTVTVTDGDLLVPSIDVTVVSDSEPAGETVTLSATPLEGKYEGTIDISATNSPGILEVTHGDLITATYNDADDGTGPAVVTDTATVDGQVAPPSSLTVEWFATSVQEAYFEDFEGDGSPTFAELGWDPTGGSSDWELDTPQGLGSPADPNSAFSGSYAIGNDMTGLGLVPGEYESSLAANTNYIVSPVIDCTGYTSCELEFMRFLGIESSTFDHASIQVSNDGVGWTVIWDFSGASFTDSDWTLVNYDISAVADNEATVYIRFDMGPTDSSVEYPGWNIDDLIVQGTVIGGTDDNYVNWTLSADDGAGDNDVSHYNVYRANNAAGPWDAGALIDSVPAGTNNYVDLGMGEFDGINWFYVIRAEDMVGNEELNTVAVPEVPLFNVPPSVPNTPAPSNGAIGVGLNPTMNVNVADPNGDILDVHFYDASGPTLIDTDFGVPSGSTASINWNGLSADTTYNWYAVADDGEFTTLSPTWSFTTMDTTPPGPVTGLTVDWWGTTSGTAMNEDFSGGIPGTWTVINGGTGTGAAETWTTANPGARAASAPITDPFAIVDSDELGSFDMDEQLITDNIDLSMALSATLEFDQYFYYYSLGGDEYGDVDVRSSNTGGSWVNVFQNHGASSSNPDHQSIDITTEAAGASDVQIRFYYYQANFDWYWMIDNILVTYVGGGTTDDNWLNWTLSGDDGAGVDDVDYYNIYRSDVQTGPWDGAHIIDTVPAGTDTYMDFGMGEFDGTIWWYVVRAEDIWGNEEMNIIAVPEPGVVLMPYDIDMSIYSAGDWAFVSFPIVISGNIETILDDSINGDGQTTWDVAKWCDAQDAADPWKTYRFGVSSNDLVTIDYMRGVWIHLTANAGDQLLTTGATGDYSAGAVNINLYTGWNLVSYPSATDRLASTTLPPVIADMVAYYDGGAAYLITDALPTAVTFSEGNAYWVHVTADTVWSVAP